MRNVLFYLFMALCAHDLERNIVFSMNDFYYVIRYTDFSYHSYSIPRNRAMYLKLLKMKWHLWQCILEKHKLIDLKILLSFVVVVPVSNSPRYGHVALGQSLSLTWSRNGRWAAFMHAHTNISLLLVSSVIE